MSAHPVVRGRRVDVVADVREPVPVDVSMLPGDWVHSLRTALDHVVHELADDPKGRSQFLVPRTGDRPTAQQWTKRVRGDIPGHRAAGLGALVETVEPFQGGADEYLWRLTTLDNTDKHRSMLGVAACVHTTRQTTQGRWMTEAEAATADTNGGLLWQVSVDKPFSHPFIKDPTLADMFHEPVLEVEYLTPESPPLADGDTIHTLTATEYREVIHIEPTFRVVIDQLPFAGVPVLDELDLITGRGTDLLNRLDRELGRG